MHDVLGSQVVVALQDLPHNFNGIRLGQLFLLPNVLMQISMGTILQHEVVKVWGLDDLKQPHHILMDELSVDLNFGLENF